MHFTESKSSVRPECDTLRPETCGGVLVTRRRKGRPVSSLSDGSCSCRNSTSSSSSAASDGERFSRFDLPLELELSIMGTVDQALLDRAQVALVKRSRSFQVRRLPPAREALHSRSTGSLEKRQLRNVGDTTLDSEGMFTTTLCSTEL